MEPRLSGQGNLAWGRPRPPLCIDFYGADELEDPSLDEELADELDDASLDDELEELDSSLEDDDRQSSFIWPGA